MASLHDIKFFQIKSHRIAYIDEGSGTPVIHAHCSGASHREWNFMYRILTNNRILAPDLIGYGDSGRLRWGDAYSFFDDVAIITEMLNRCDQPAHLVGHSFGGAMALEACRLNPEKVATLTLIEPVSFHLLRQSDYKKEWQIIKKMSNHIIANAANNKHKKAAAIFMNYWLGRVKWFFMPARLKASVYDTIEKVALEFYGLEHVDLPLELYKAIKTPTLLVAGSRTPPPATKIINLLARLIPNSRTKTIRGAGHMSPFTHPEDIKKIILSRIDSNQQYDG